MLLFCGGICALYKVTGSRSCSGTSAFELFMLAFMGWGAGDAHGGLLGEALFNGAPKL